MDNPIIVKFEKVCQEFETIQGLIKKLYTENPNKEILLLARRNRDIADLFGSGLFKSGVDDEVLVKEVPDARVRILTMHSSKGVTADQVIIYRLHERIFPSKGLKSHWIFNYFKVSLPTNYIIKINDYEETNYYHCGIHDAACAGRGKERD